MRDATASRKVHERLRNVREKIFLPLLALYFDSDLRVRRHHNMVSLRENVGWPYLHTKERFVSTLRRHALRVAHRLGLQPRHTGPALPHYSEGGRRRQSWVYRDCRGWRLYL